MPTCTLSCQCDQFHACHPRYKTHIVVDSGDGRCVLVLRHALQLGVAVQLDLVLVVGVVVLLRQSVCVRIEKG